MQKVPMGPPPPREPESRPSEPHSQQSPLLSSGSPTSNDVTQEDNVSANSKLEASELCSAKLAVLEGLNAAPSSGRGETNSHNSSEGRPQRSSSGQIYQIPPWSEPPGQPYFLEVLKEGSIIDNLDVSEKGAYMFGRSDQCDFVLEHPSVSRYHAVLQFKGNGDVFIYDLGSTHGSFVNKTQIKPKVYKQLHVGDILRFGQSTRLYILQGPSELMPPERPIRGGRQNVNEMLYLEEKAAMEASLLRARQDASLAEGISWGIAEDAVEEDIKEEEELTWQTYKGQLTEKQQKTRDKVIKRTEKLSNLKKEIDAIRAKEISQGGLTQGQQTQIARNEQRIEQIVEELENLEETLNQSIQESIGAQSGRLGSSKKKHDPDEDEVESDEDEFYDRTMKGRKGQKNAEKVQVVETAESLLEKKENLAKDLEDTKAALEAQKSNNGKKTSTQAEDPLDAFMTGVSSQIVKDQELRLQQKLESLQSEMDRVIYLLKIADPRGEASQRRHHHVTLRQGHTRSDENKTACIEMNEPSEHKPENIQERMSPKLSSGKDTSSSVIEIKDKMLDGTAVLKKPVWLGAGCKDADKEETAKDSNRLDQTDSEHFVSYKDRKSGQLTSKNTSEFSSLLEDAKGLVLRKPKQVQKKFDNGEEQQVVAEDLKETTCSTSGDAETSAADAVALLLRHKRGLVASDEEDDNQDSGSMQNSMNLPEKKKSRKLGPDKPVFLNSETNDYDSWLPPQGQTGDGRTALNDKYGY
eukprot:TRINITY_DN1060_c0_g1_i1.p1 TRINITY_DN1060_c0_g1~~TRINITY_DN1060_c0_g1_i1.p1  ORF type:complete len:751 (+),score=218.77 TRINITY_DN1060_c0_g1_i1:121-2373(+)